MNYNNLTHKINNEENNGFDKYCFIICRMCKK